MMNWEFELGHSLVIPVWSLVILIDNSVPMTTAIHLRGMTWNHSRGYTPMVATAQRFCESRADRSIEIVWDKRSLQEFADQPIDTLAKEYDLLVIDHPWAG